MPISRKDIQGRALRPGESQRKDGLYVYRFSDGHGKRRSIYEPDLLELRKREDEILALERDGLDYASGEMTVIQLLERYLKLKINVRYNTRVGYNFVLNLVKKQAFGQRTLHQVKTSDAKLWLVDLFNEGYAYSTIASIRGVMRPAFEMAVTDEILRRNPFSFRLDFIPNNTQKRVALTPKQQKALLDFVKQDPVYSHYWDEINVLLGTGMRISEFCGLTMADLDFEERRIRVDHQLVRRKDGQRFVEKTKTEASCRYIPMSDSVYESLYNILKNRKRPQKEQMIDGYVGFILLDKNGNPKVANHIEKALPRIRKKYNDANVIPLPPITPHVFRHTFCTNFASKGMNIKSLQYLMGHSDANVTMNVYTHNSYEMAAESMAEIVPIDGSVVIKQA